MCHFKGKKRYNIMNRTKAKLDAKLMPIWLTKEGLLKWTEGKAISILDVRLEYREALGANFISRKEQTP